jgi:hypothetical protein
MARTSVPMIGMRNSGSFASTETGRGIRVKRKIGSMSEFG